MPSNEVDLNFYQRPAHYAGRTRGTDGKYYHQYLILDQNQSDDPSASQPPHEKNDLVNNVTDSQLKHYLENRLQYLTDEARIIRECLAEKENTEGSKRVKEVGHSSYSKSTSHAGASVPVHLREKTLQCLKQEHGLAAWISMNASEQESALLRKCAELQSHRESEEEGAALAQSKAAELPRPHNPTEMKVDAIPAPKHQQLMPEAQGPDRSAVQRRKQAAIDRDIAMRRQLKKRRLQEDPHYYENFIQNVSSTQATAFKLPIAPAREPSAVEVSTATSSTTATTAGTGNTSTVNHATDSASAASTARQSPAKQETFSIAGTTAPAQPTSSLSGQSAKPEDINRFDKLFGFRRPY